MRLAAVAKRLAWLFALAVVHPGCGRDTPVEPSGVNAYERQHATVTVGGGPGLRAMDDAPPVEHAGITAEKSQPDPKPSCCAASQAAPLQSVHSDAEIAAMIRDQLRRSPFLDASAIYVSVTGGRAVLTGEVATAAEHSLATQDALKGGALEVDNRLHVVATKVTL